MKPDWRLNVGFPLVAPLLSQAALDGEAVLVTVTPESERGSDWITAASQKLRDRLPDYVVDGGPFALRQATQLNCLIVGNVDPDAHDPYPLYPRTASMMWSCTSSVR